MLKYIKKKIAARTLKEHYLCRNKVLLKRREGGYGDILVSRMLCEDMHRIMPDIELTYGCVDRYKSIMQKHPYAEIVGLNGLDESKYGSIYDISIACAIHESTTGIKNSMNRSDVWAKHCGYTLTKHNAYLKKENDEQYRELINKENLEKKPTILFVPSSIDYDYGRSKSLLYNLAYDVVKVLREMGFYVYSTNSENISALNDLNVKQYIRPHEKDWIGIVGAADYILTIDTATLHIAGMLEKPLIGIFGHTNGKLVCKYYDHVLVQKHKDDGNWPCGPCYVYHSCTKSNEEIKPCISELTTEEIIAGVKKAIIRWPHPHFSTKPLLPLPLETIS